MKERGNPKMKTRVGESQIQKAKTVNLIKYLLSHYPDKITKDPHNDDKYVHPDYATLVIKERFFKRFASDVGGDQIQFLINYCGKTFVQAVLELCLAADLSVENTLLDVSEEEKVSSFVPPKPLNGRYARVWSYLVLKRRIPEEYVVDLFEKKLLYQAADYGNCVFLSDTCKYAELHGTTDIKYKKIHTASEADGFWLYGDDDPEFIYICKSAIDAISLYVLCKRFSPEEKIKCASVGGLKEKSVQRIISCYGKKAVIAMGNSLEGWGFAENFEDTKKIRTPCVTKPEYAIKDKASKTTEDWNDILRFCDDGKLISDAIKDKFYSDLPF
ncbi:MAG: DUF3991 domain-containing protein [Clostridia bacterium]|nr:DUF3991 domain-containing protein [Clostridia bacterium]